MMPIFRFPFGRNNYMYPMHFYNSHIQYGLNTNISSQNNTHSHNKRPDKVNNDVNKQFKDLNRIQTKINSENKKTKNENIKFTEEKFKKNDSSKINKEKEDSYFFEIFGIKLYLDDILLISLIFFLYKENVHDEELFISLILLLLT